jgi:lysophospholipase L1-like esterase
VRFAAGATVLFFLVVELLLRTTGAVIRAVRVTAWNPPRSGDTTLRIMTVGDSLTAGQGTAPEYSYPRQLESILRAANPTLAVEVVNQGVYALNSSRLADLLPGWLDEHRPDVLVVMSGCNNSWNYENSHLGVLGLDDRPAVQRVLDHSKLYRVLRVALKRKRGPISIVAQPQPIRDGMALPSDLAPPRRRHGAHARAPEAADGRSRRARRALSL